MRARVLAYLVHHGHEHAGVDGGAKDEEVGVPPRAAAPDGARARAGEEAEAEDEDGVDDGLGGLGGCLGGKMRTESMMAWGGLGKEGG